MIEKDKPIKVEDITLIWNFLIVEPYTPPTESFIPPADNELRPTYGIVKAIGDDIIKDISIGDIVIFGMYASSKLFINDRDYFIIKDQDVVGVIKR